MVGWMALVRPSHFKRLFSTAPPTRSRIRLRDYQQECIDTCLRELSAGVRRQAVSLPVGSGKTVIFSNLIPKIPSPSPEATKTLVLAHRSELLVQAVQQIRRHSPGLTVIRDQAQKIPSPKEIEECDVVVASVQTLGRVATERINAYDPAKFKCIIIDEAHHAAASGYIRILKSFGALDPDSHIFVWGCSATLRRHDGLSLGEAFDKVVYNQPFLEMIAKKNLCEMAVISVETNLSLDGVQLKYGDFVESQLGKAINTPVRNGLIKDVDNGNPRRHSTIIFAVNVEHIRDLVQVFRDAGVDARGMHGGTKKSEREKTLDDFKAGLFPVLINCGIMTEGVDVPRTDCIILGRPTRSSGLLQQMIGRGLRRFKDENGNDLKENCLIIDMVDTFRDGGLNATIPTLLGLRHDFQFSGGASSQKEMEEMDKMIEEFPEIADQAKSLEEARRLYEKFSQRGVKVDIRFKEFGMSHIQELRSLQADSEILSDYSRLAWVRIGPRHFALNIKPNETLLVSYNEDTGNLEAVFRQRREKDGKFWVKDSNIAAFDNLETAMKTCDTWAKSKAPEVVLSRWASWRQQPPTTNQLNCLVRMGVHSHGHYLTKGQAADLITRAILGAAGKAKAVDVEEKQKKGRKAKRDRHRNSLL
ncbi:hypothetical protein HDV05_008654 [Chytridiales sp. JEL 0842]|nr:hypothetical protein HDV05_008654 [Chytridiales sp. JEL 0842]